MSSSGKIFKLPQQKQLEIPGGRGVLKDQNVGRIVKAQRKLVGCLNRNQMQSLVLTENQSSTY